MNSSLLLLNKGDFGLARSVAILGMEESGKAIAIHQRRVSIAFSPEGDPFVNKRLQDIWSSHPEKLRLVHDFLAEEPYWYGVTPPDHELNEEYLGEIDQWSTKCNMLKQRGFYVDFNEQQGLLSPRDVDQEMLRDVISHVHQIGWQLRLGEDIEARKQERKSRDVPPASESQIKHVEKFLKTNGRESQVEKIIGQLRSGRPGIKLNNDAYRPHVRTPETHPLKHLGKPGYEAYTRELLMLAEDAGMDEEDLVDLVRPQHEG